MKKSRILLISGLCLLAAGLFGNSLYIQAKAHLAQYLIASAWQQTVRDNRHLTAIEKPALPWSWADTYPIAKLRLPRYKVEQYVLAGASGSPLAFAPGWYAGTRLPGKTPQANSEETLPDTVIAGHHNTHFAFLKQLQRGDDLYLQTFQGQIQHYRISRVDFFDIHNSRLPARWGGKTLTLVTCAPDFIGEIHPNRRLVVTAVLQAI